MISKDEISEECNLTTDAVPEFPRILSDNSGSSPEDRNYSGSDRPGNFLPSNQSQQHTHNMNAHGNIININASSHVHIGNNINMLMGRKGNKKYRTKSKDPSGVPPADIQSTFSLVIPCNEADISSVSKIIGEKWCELGNVLGYDAATLHQFLVRTNSLSEAIFCMLLDWIHLNDNGATVGVLCKSLWEANEKIAAKHLHTKLQKSQN